MSSFHQIIDKIGDELNIKVTHLSDNWVIVLEKDRQIHYIEGHKFDLNNHAIGNIIDDKGLFYDILKYKQIPCCFHKVIFKNYDKNEVESFFFEHHQEIIVKGNVGTCGKLVFKICDLDTLFKTIDYLFRSQYSVSLCPYYDIENEYRVILLNKEIRLLYGKRKPLIIGDGKSNVQSLLEKNNLHLRTKIIDEKYIPKKNEIVELDFRFNLSCGGTLFWEIDEELRKKIENLAFKVVSELNISFASVDIIYTKNHELLVLEANSGIMMTNLIKLNGDKGYNIAYNLYKEAIELMFRKKE